MQNKEFDPKFADISIYPLQKNNRMKELLEAVIEKFDKHIDTLNQYPDPVKQKHFRIKLLDAFPFSKDGKDDELLTDIKSHSPLYLDLSLDFEKCESDEIFGKVYTSTIRYITIGLSDGGSIFFPSYKIADVVYTTSYGLDDGDNRKSVSITFI